MAFAGDTLWAYPIIAQTINSIAAFEPSRERRYDLLDARGHALRVINDMITSGDAIQGPDPPDSRADFLFGGFSANKGRFRLWNFSYVASDGCFRAEPILPRSIGTVSFIGDVGSEARRRLRELMDAYNGGGLLDMQPFEVIRDLLREHAHDTIGGPPQLAKVYRHMNTEAFAIEWSPAPGEVEPRLTLLGRTLLDYEQLGVPKLVADNPSLPPHPGRGEVLATWDSVFVRAVNELTVADADALVKWCESNAVQRSPEEIDEWLDYALRRGMLTSPTHGSFQVPGGCDDDEDWG
jgi:hypothetical protein